MKKLLAVLALVLFALPAHAVEPMPRLMGLRTGGPGSLFFYTRMPLFQVGTTAPGHTVGGGSGGGVTGTLVSGRVPFANGAGSVTDDSDMTFATDTLTVTKIIGSTSITDSGLSAGRVTFAGTSGILADDSDMTFATDTLTVTKIAATTFTGSPVFSTGAVLNTDQILNLGTTVSAAFPAIQFNTTDTVDTGMLLTGTTSNHWVIAERQDNTFDFAHAATTDPTLFIHSHNQSTSEYVGIWNDGTYSDFLSGSGPGRFRFISGAVTTALLAIDTDVRTRSGMNLGWSSSSTDATTGVDAFFRRKAAATVQMGADANGAVTAQQIQGANGITGTDIVAGNFTVGGQVGTGAGAGSQTNINRALILATGTTAQSNANAVTVCESKALSTTTATATAVANVGLANNTAGAVRAEISVQCSDGTNFDSDLVTTYVAYVNKAGALTIGTPVTTGTAAANNSGSCTVAPTIVANGTTSVDIKVTPVFSTIVPTSSTAFVLVHNFGPGAVTCK